jgi:hypothetical protein
LLGCCVNVASQVYSFISASDVDSFLFKMSESKKVKSLCIEEQKSLLVQGDADK